MNLNPNSISKLAAALFLAGGCFLSATLNAQDGPPDGGPGPGGPPFGRGGFGPGRMNGQETKVLKQFDKNGNGILDASERKPAREFLQTQGGGRGGRGWGRRGGPGGFGPAEEAAKPGPKLTPAEVKNFPQAPLYDPQTLRTFFLEFEEADWEKELEAFHNTDVDVPAKLTVDGKVYPDVGVRFRGMSSYMGVSEGRKRSFNLSMDLAHKDQNIGGYHTLNLLNSHEDPSFLRSVLSYQIDRAYIPAPKANFARVVINGESWGIYVNVEQFNKTFTKEWFGSTKGARWKVPGSPGGQGSLAYLGDNPAPYKRIYSLKTKDDPKRWTDLAKLCKTLNETPPDKLEKALDPIFDIEGALKFMALDITLINNDGYWIRSSDYAIFQDEKGRFHLIPQDSNETFSKLGGPGFGGRGGRGGRGQRFGGAGQGGGQGGFGGEAGPRGPGGPGGPGGFGPAMILAPQMFSQADSNGDQKLTRAEFTALADTWFDKLDPDKSAKFNQEQFSDKLSDLLPPPEGFGPPGGGGGAEGRRGFGPGRFLGPMLFTAADTDKDSSLTRAELKAAFDKWFTAADTEKHDSLTEESFRTGLASALPAPDFGAFGGGMRGPGGGPRGGFGGRGFGGPQGQGVELDPLFGLNDTSKPLLTKLLSVPALRTRYLGYVRDIAEKWLDWQKLGPIAEQYHALIAEDVKADTRKLDSTEAFQKSLTEDVQGNGFGPFGGGSIGLKNFADQRRKYLLEYPEIKKLSQ